MELSKSVKLFQARGHPCLLPGVSAGTVGVRGLMMMMNLQI
jgi:hypothetical protein